MYICVLHNGVLLVETLPNMATLNPWNLSMPSIWHKKDFVDMTKSKMLKWGDYPLPWWIWCNHGSPYGKNTKGSELEAMGM